MENFVFAILMLGCDHTLDHCSYVPAPMEYYATRAECEDVLPHAFHEAENHPVALGDCVAVPGKWIEQDVALEWSIDGKKRLKVAVIGPGNAVYGEVAATELASRTGRAKPTG